MLSRDLVCFSTIQTAAIGNQITFFTAMSARKFHPPTEEGEPKRVKTPEIDMFLYIDCVNPVFNPNRFLLRRTFFIDSDKTKYVSVVFHPTKNYNP